MKTAIIIGGILFVGFVLLPHIIKSILDDNNRFD